MVPECSGLATRTSPEREKGGGRYPLGVTREHSLQQVGDKYEGFFNEEPFQKL